MKNRCPVRTGLVALVAGTMIGIGGCGGDASSSENRLTTSEYDEFVRIKKHDIQSARSLSGELKTTKEYAQNHSIFDSANFYTIIRNDGTRDERGRVIKEGGYDGGIITVTRPALSEMGTHDIYIRPNENIRQFIPLGQYLKYGVKEEERKAREEEIRETLSRLRICNDVQVDTGLAMKPLDIHEVPIEVKPGNYEIGKQSYAEVYSYGKPDEKYARALGSRGQIITIMPPHGKKEVFVHPPARDRNVDTIVNGLENVERYLSRIPDEKQRAEERAEIETVVGKW